MTSKFVPVPKSIISSNLKGITVSAPPGTIKPGLPSVVLLNLYPPKSLFNIHHYYTKSIKYFFFIINLYSDLGGLSFYEDNTGKYVVGADSVPKKLGKVPFMVTGLNFYVQRDFNDSHGGAIGSSNSLYFSFDIAEYETMSVGTVVTTQTNTYDTSNVFYKVDDGVWVKLTSNLVLDISSNSLVTIRPAPTSYGNMNSTGSGSVKISSIIFS